MKKVKTVFTTILIFAVIVAVVFIAVYKTNNDFRNWVNTNFKLEQSITSPDKTASASKPTIVVIEELEANQKKIEDKVDNLKIEFENTDISNTEKLENLKAQLSDIENELADIKYQIGLLKSNLTNFSNSNLLINSNFSVNQRSKTTYTEANKYTVDRWLLTGGSLKVDSIGVTLTGTGQGLKQFIENPAILSERVITLSVKAIGTYKVIIQINSTNIELDLENNSATVSLPEIKNSDKVAVILQTQENTVSYKSVKLEFGEIATEFNPRLFVEELNFCQRYYYQLGSVTEYIPVGIGQFNTTNNVFCSGLYTTTMRNIPTTTFTGEMTLRSGNNYLKATTLNNYGSGKSFQLSITTNGSQPAGLACDIFLGKNSYITFDAEIY